MRENSRQSPKFILKRDKRESRRAELGRYFATMDWQLLFSSASGCQDMLDILHNAIHTGLDILMPVKRVRVNTSDVPWMTSHLKSLILKRQKAFREHGAESSCYKFYRNAVNRERKSSKASFYKIKVEHMKDENPKLWWKEVKRLCGPIPTWAMLPITSTSKNSRIVTTRNLQTLSTRLSLNHLKNIAWNSR